MPFSAEKAALLEASVLPNGKRPPVSISESPRRLAGQTLDRVFSYNAHALHTWMCLTLVFRGALCNILSVATIMQGCLMVGAAVVLAVSLNQKNINDVPCKHVYFPDGYVTVDPITGNTTENPIEQGLRPMMQCAEFFRTTFLSKMLTSMEQQIGQLTRFVLGGFVSVALANTYYSNRGLLGTVFGKTLATSMSVASCIKPSKPEQAEEVQAIRTLIVRWLNSAFLLMYLENAQLIDANGSELLDGALTSDEWEHIATLPSRCTHLYQWTGSLIMDCANWGYVAHPMAAKMYSMVEELRGSNVWGLPSLPYPYAFIITYEIAMKASRSRSPSPSASSSHSSHLPLGSW